MAKRPQSKADKIALMSDNLNPEKKSRVDDDKPLTIFDHLRQLTNTAGIFNKKQTTVSVLQLFRFASLKQKLLFLAGLIGAALNALPMPVMLIVYGKTTDTFVQTMFCDVMQTLNISDYCPPVIDASNINQLYLLCNWTGSNVTLPVLTSNVSEQAIMFTIIGVVAWIFSWIQSSFLSNACERIIFDVRLKYFRSVLTKPVRYFDKHDSGSINHELTETIGKYKHGIGDKVGMIAQSILTAIASVVISLIYGWKLSLVLLAISPILIVVLSYMTTAAGQSTTLETKAYSKAGSIAQQSFANIRTVQAFNGVAVMKDKYCTLLEEAKHEGIVKGRLNAVMLACLWLFLFASYSLGFWYGSRLVEEGLTVGSIVIIYFGIQSVMFGLGGSLPHYSALTEARSAARTIYSTIDANAGDSVNFLEADSDKNQTGIPWKTPASSSTSWKEGDITFDKVDFSYPSRPDVKILRQFSARIPNGSKIAVVGESGCGKSTLVQLLLRFYEPDAGTISIGDTVLNDIHVKDLRSVIGMVGQEPVLFSTTIAENIKLGKPGASDEEVVKACQLANADSFIEKFPSKYDTMVGESGSQLSGGQKQRIAIARALISDPAILLLDEATSALDSESERFVQQALDTASKGRTTIIIAHRLSTIRDADIIIGMRLGSAVETGTHDGLMKNPGIYKLLVESQSKDDSGDEDEDDFIFDDVEDDQKNKKKRLVSAASMMSANVSVSDPSATPAETQASVWVIFKYMIAINKPEFLLIIIACVACILWGVMMCVFELYFARVLVLFGHCDPVLRQHQINNQVIAFVVIAIVSGLSQLTSSWIFSISGERLTKRIRSMLFENITRREIGFFDNQDNSIGSLCTMLSTEASAIQGATGIRIGTILSGCSILLVGILISFVLGWQLSLVILAFVPVIIGSGLISMKFISGFDAKDKPIIEKASKVVVESTSNIRTVKQLQMESYCFNKYKDTLLLAYQKNLRKTLVTGFLFGASQGVVFFVIAVVYYIAAIFIERGFITTENMMVVFGCLIFGAMSIGQSQAMAPDFGKSLAASTKIYKMMHKKPEIDANSTDGLILGEFKGNYKFENTQFSYPTRRKVKVLKKLNIDFPSNKSVALVGSSGCGKSTIIQLIERFYDPNSGVITVDGVDLRDLNIKWYRQHLGIVSQEPVLFDWSIAENIKFGDTSRQVSLDEIRAVCKQCNIDHFITQLPGGYETVCGTKGSLMSGGQKQRICIARALIRNPRMLLLDEATSALDTESEKVVQEALDAAQENRGSITVAHRLTTIQNSDVIHVMNAGRLEESGTHDHLLTNKYGLYTSLYKLLKR